MSDAASYNRVFKHAKRSRDDTFTVLYKANEFDRARLGLAISKKHCKLATGRNRLKRLVRESFRTHRKALAGLDVIVLNRPAAAKTENSELTARLEKHWQRCRDNSADGAGKN
jgi:ribonuclease P protein component